MLTKADMPERIETPRTVVRLATAEDLPRIAAWPPYPPPYAWANMVPPDGSLSDRAGKPLWWRRIDWPDRAHYSVVDAAGEVIGVYAFCNIDWQGGQVGNMGIRLRADRCDTGVGQETLAPLLRAMLAAGFRRIRLDVAAPNARAVRCYQHCGMRVAEEWWREGKVPDDPADPIWPLLRPHLRREGDKWMVRFYWMEITA